MTSSIRLLILLLFWQPAFSAGNGGVIGKNPDGYSGKVFLVTLGVNKYSGTGYANLQSAELDAANFKKRLERDSSVKSVRTWAFNSDHSKKDVLAAFDEITAVAGPSDAFVFFCAAQSSQRGLILSDGSELTAAELYRKSQQVYSARQLFYLDACYGDMFIADLKRQLMSEPEQSAMGKLNRVVLGVRGIANENKDGGFFTQSYTQSNVKIMDVFAESHRLQVRLLNNLYNHLEGFSKKMTIDFFSEKEYYLAAVEPVPAPTRSSVKGGEVTKDKPVQKIRIRKGETLSLLIGCSKFDNFRGLNNTLRDAKALKARLEEKYWHRTILLEDPTSIEFRAQLAAISEEFEFEEGSQFLFFAATHGAKDENGDGVMVFKDSRMEGKFLEKTYSLISIKKAISQLDCTNTLMLVDICHSGTMFDDGSCMKPNAIEIPVTSPIFASKGTGSPAFKKLSESKDQSFYRFFNRPGGCGRRSRPLTFCHSGASFPGTKPAACYRQLPPAAGDPAGGDAGRRHFSTHVLQLCMQGRRQVPVYSEIEII